jgi:hypothetical protein
MKRVLILALLIAVLSQMAPTVSAGPLMQGGGAAITSPRGPVVVRGSVLISGTAVHANFDFYKVEFAPGTNPRDDQWSLIGSTHTSPVQNGLLETWHTMGLIPDGTYSLRLRVVRKDGNFDEDIVRQITVANALPTETSTLSAPIRTSTPTHTSTQLPPTATIVIEVPVPVTPEPPTRVPEIRPTATPGPSFSLDRMVSSMLWGGGIVLAVFIVIGFFALVRQLFRLIVNR